MTSQAIAAPGGGAIAAQIEVLHGRLEALSNVGDWSGFAAVMKRRDELLGAVQVNDRATVFAAAKQSNDRMLKLTRAARQGIADQLTAMRRGRDMTSSYELHRAAPNKSQ